MREKNELFYTPSLLLKKPHFRKYTFRRHKISSFFKCMYASELMLGVDKVFPKRKNFRHEEPSAFALEPL